MQPEGQLALEASEELEQLDSWLREHLPAAAAADQQQGTECDPTALAGSHVEPPPVDREDRRDEETERREVSDSGASGGAETCSDENGGHAVSCGTGKDSASLLREGLLEGISVLTSTVDSLSGVKSGLTAITSTL